MSHQVIVVKFKTGKTCQFKTRKTCQFKTRKT
jgi:hypothetical protein